MRNFNQRFTTALLAGILAATLGSPRLLAQSAPAPAAPDPAPPSGLAGINLSGLIDGYYSYNANRPLQSENGNQLRNFDFDANTLTLSMAKLTLSREAAPIGFHVDLGFGKAFTTILSNQPDFKYLEQAYVTYRPNHAKGFQVDVGEFVTSAGAEVIESKDNWNYSRSLLFALAIPYYHVGVRTSMPISKTFAAGVQLVNGWNTFTDNNTGKTVGLTGAWARPKFTLFTNYYVGPENSNTNKGYRNLLDGTLLLTPSTKLNAYINYDYGQNRNAVQTATGAYQTSDLSRWQGVALDLRYQASSKLAFSPRWEYFSDRSAFSTGLAQNLNEVTLTGEYKLHEGVFSRVEYRRDHSDHDFFNRGSSTVPTQSTFEVALIAFFRPSR